MPKQTINIGSSANDGTGDPLRTAFDKINDNFDELYSTSLSERVSLDTSPQLGGDLDVVTHSIVSTTNRDIVLAPHGTGSVKASSLKFSGTSISSDDSTQVQINEGLNVSGATSLSTSLALATGATVTGILDEDNMGTNSATQLATQQSIKAYVDSQVTAQDLDLAGDSGTGAVDLDSQSLTIAGGTGLTSVAGSQTVTLNIDATVATLAGSQTLTNKVITAPTINGATMTGNVTVDNITLNDNIISSSSNADLILDPAGTGAINLTAATNVTGTATVTGQLNVDNLRMDANTISATSGGITISPATNQNLALGGLVTATEFQSTLGEFTTLRTDTLSTDTSNGDLTIGTQGTGNIVIDTETIARTGDMILDVSGDIYLDADGGDIFLKDGSAGTFAAFFRSGTNDLTISSSGTSALIFTDANVAAQGNLSVAGSSTLDGVTITDNTVSTNASNADLQLGANGTGVIDVLTATQTTVGSAGGASALPGQPTGYIKIKIGGTLRVIPFYDQA